MLKQRAGVTSVQTITAAGLHKLGIQDWIPRLFRPGCSERKIVFAIYYHESVYVKLRLSNKQIMIMLSLNIKKENEMHLINLLYKLLN